MKRFAQQYIGRVTRMLAALDLETLEQVVTVLSAARARGSHVFTLGNGGSAASATHFAADLNRINENGAPPFRSIALTDNLSQITAWANDTHYENIFQRQLANLVKRDDVVAALSCSGDSPNVLSALEFAKTRGATTLALVGSPGGRAAAIADHALCLDDGSYEVVEDGHAVVCHILACYLGAREPRPWPSPAAEAETPS